MLCVESKITEMMTRRIVDLIKYVKKSKGSALTTLVSLISPTSPGQLEWKQACEPLPDEEKFGACFESSGAQYAVNLFTGVVLTDGNAPGGLPLIIREHKRFQALFGSCNFEVFSVGDMFQAKSTYCDRLYEFALQENDELFVQELVLDPSRNIGNTLQLCSLSWIETINDKLPARLWELYSHWYWVERNCVLFRPIEAKDRKVFFIATFDEQGVLQCYQVPLSDMSCSYNGS
ncbi:unnamed protein product [Peronospora destructor]|uniref:Uncharacterized protein n=1 Tax=Peronospora destructor TaxID=86335 RepID=A0AAV0VJV0_9STRA|nr:unnamed protein product [Peronospora destructor]